MFNNNLLRLRLILTTLINSHLSAKRVQVRLLNSKNYSLIISIQTLSRLNKNPLSLLSRLEENGINLKIKTIDKTHKATKGISHVTSVVIHSVRITEILVQLGELHVIFVGNVVISQSAATRRNDE